MTAVVFCAAHISLPYPPAGLARFLLRETEEEPTGDVLDKWLWRMSDKLLYLGLSKNEVLKFYDYATELNKTVSEKNWGTIYISILNLYTISGDIQIFRRDHPEYFDIFYENRFYIFDDFLRFTDKIPTGGDEQNLALYGQLREKYMCSEYGYNVMTYLFEMLK